MRSNALHLSRLADWPCPLVCSGCAFPLSTFYLLLSPSLVPYIFQPPALLWPPLHPSRPGRPSRPDEAAAATLAAYQQVRSIGPLRPPTMRTCAAARCPLRPAPPRRQRAPPALHPRASSRALHLHLCLSFPASLTHSLAQSRQGESALAAAPRRLARPARLGQKRPDQSRESTQRPDSLCSTLPAGMSFRIRSAMIG